MVYLPKLCNKMYTQFLSIFGGNTQLVNYVRYNNIEQSTICMHECGINFLMFFAFIFTENVTKLNLRNRNTS